MKDTVNETRMRKATLTELASRVPEANFEDLKTAFLMHDRDRSGHLSHDMFMRCLQIASMNAT
jgi:Ca2+-binding EF-hand superfamily protein